MVSAYLKWLPHGTKCPPTERMRKLRGSDPIRGNNGQVITSVQCYELYSEVMSKTFSFFFVSLGRLGESIRLLKETLLLCGKKQAITQLVLKFWQDADDVLISVAEIWTLDSYLCWREHRSRWDEEERDSGGGERGVEWKERDKDKKSIR